MGCSSSSHRIVGFSSCVNRNPILNSNPDPNQNPVHLCRDRTELIRSACDRRYAAAAAHVDYLRSLSTLGGSLLQFAAAELTTSAPGSPVLTLPTSSKGKSKAGSDSDSSTVTPLSHSLSFEDDEEEKNLNSSTVTPLTHELSFEERKPEKDSQSNTSRKVEEGSRSSLKNNNMAETKTMPSPTNSYHPYNYGYVYGYDGYGYGFGYETTNSNLNFDDRPGPSNPVTPPMQVPDSSVWEFFDPFSNYDQFKERYEYLNSNSNSDSDSYHSSPDSNKVRKQEGIPDLEDEIKFEEKQKEIEIEREKQNEKEIEIEREKQNEKEIEIETEKEKEKEKETENGDKEENKMDASGSATMEKFKSISTEEGSGSGVKNKEVRFEDEKVTKTSNSDNGPDMLVAVQLRDLDEVIEQIKEQFDFAADCVKEASVLLEVNKVPYRSSALGNISSRFLDPTLPILPDSCLPHKRPAKGKTGRASGSSSASTANGDIKRLTPLSLSLTLDKLYVWEKRLYKEVKDEEKLRAEYERKYQRLKYLDEHGADYNIIKSANDAFASLRNRISVVMRSADTISKQIQHIRDEELQPQLVLLVQGLIRMWRSILDCHKKQLTDINDLNTHNIKARIGFNPKRVARFTLRLEKEISRWHRSFKSWIETQKLFIEALNGYLMRWIRNEPDPEEDILDGVPPFSPARIGAPVSFIISNDWYQGVQNVSEVKILKCICNFKNMVRQYRKLQEEESRCRTKAKHLSVIYNRKLKSLQDELGIYFGAGNLEIISSNGKENLEGLELETSHHMLEHHRQVAQLEAMKRRRDEERKRHKEVLEKVNELGSGVLKTGLLPIFEELDNFLTDNLKSYEAVRVSIQI
ncbi:hypothetical protein LUZ63_003973 [Rhynchospora breviuscula]|uniref:Uncharacterized protein n=1 Tax=Rhynchospora breviuscula TaxID=2022672 RepID=A0A9Q0D3A1_9POAL|nr:hypothetical protein LUZ63_003973 [Rhynchospora breviuscula]